MSIITKFKDYTKKIVFTFIKPPTKYIYNSYSQAGEDSILHFLFQDKNMKSISYLDIGTNSPDFGNNTYLFYTRGSTGVCVEADVTLITEIKKVRPKDAILNVGVSVSNKTEATFYIFDEPSINTFDEQEAYKREKFGTHKIVDKRIVKLFDINQIIKDNFVYNYPDLLSLDIEGLDFEVLKSLDWDSYPIPVLCIETCTYSENHIRPKSSEIINFVLSKGYFVYADTYINTIFVNKKWFEQVK
jgi:FkbM family methyltransferase